MTQADTILKHLKKFRSITALSALELYGVARLSARIIELRERYNIKTVLVSGLNRYKTPVRFAKYIYKGRGFEKVCNDTNRH